MGGFTTLGDTELLSVTLDSTECHFKYHVYNFNLHFEKTAYESDTVLPNQSIPRYFFFQPSIQL